MRTLMGLDRQRERSRPVCHVRREDVSLAEVIPAARRARAIKECIATVAEIPRFTSRACRPACCTCCCGTSPIAGATCDLTGSCSRSGSRTPCSPTSSPHAAPASRATRFAPGLVPFAWLVGYQASITSTVLKTQAVRDAGGFPDANIAEDWYLAARLARRGPFICIDDEVRVYHRHPGALRTRGPRTSTATQQRVVCANCRLDERSTRLQRYRAVGLIPRCTLPPPSSTRLRPITPTACGLRSSRSRLRETEPGAISSSASANTTYGVSTCSRPAFRAAPTVARVVSVRRWAVDGTSTGVSEAFSTTTTAIGTCSRSSARRHWGSSSTCPSQTGTTTVTVGVMRQRRATDAPMMLATAAAARITTRARSSAWVESRLWASRPRTWPTTRPAARTGTP
jgi:hypothetical protein